ncbi:hypothetical protein U0070_002575, partial [Myodes glareolus]
RPCQTCGGTANPASRGHLPPSTPSPESAATSLHGGDTPLSSPRSADSPGLSGSAHPAGSLALFPAPCTRDPEEPRERLQPSWTTSGVQASSVGVRGHALSKGPPETERGLRARPEEAAGGRGEGPSLQALIFYYFNKTDWIFGDAMCKLQRFIFHVNLYGSILFLTCISAHRYSGVVYPLKSLGRLKKKNAVYVSVLVWLIVVVAISPILFYSGTGMRKNKTITCYDTTADDYLRSYFIYSMCTTVAMFCIPLVLILGCYGLIVRALIYKDLDNSPLRRKSIYLVIIVLTVFAVSYIPFHVMKTMNLRARLDFQTPEMCAFNDRVYATYQVTRGLASLNSCVDPILYFLAGDTFRRRLSRATRKASRRSEANLQSKSEEMTLNILSEFKQNGDTSL